MFKYNDDNLFVGYIKQLLSSFNYPDMDVYSTKLIPVENNFYLKDNHIVYYKNGGFKDISLYTNKSVLNLTKNFHNKSFIYDEETHSYLGDYLRFIRDYKGLNLMSLYNCFSNTIAQYSTVEGFDVTNTNYTIYSMPIKLFEKYSLYIECTGKVEIIGTLNEDSTSEEWNLNKITKKSIYNSSFNKPILIEGLDKYNLLKVLSKEDISKLYNKRSKIRLLIKVPVSTKSSIVLLEGIYLNSNDFILSTDSNEVFKDFKIKSNHSVNNYEYFEDGELNTNFISPLSLLHMNTGVSHPFADRLMEYILDNAVTPLDPVSDNIKRIQKLLQDRYYTMDGDNHLKLGMKEYKDYGYWEDRLTNTLYDIEVFNNDLGEIKDILGYLDKDVEKDLGNDINIYTRSDGGYDL